MQKIQVLAACLSVCQKYLYKCRKERIFAQDYQYIESTDTAPIFFICKKKNVSFSIYDIVASFAEKLPSLFKFLFFMFLLPIYSGLVHVSARESLPLKLLALHILRNRAKVISDTTLGK